MAFKRTPSKTFRADVTVNVANESGGYDKNKFVAIFSHASTKELDDLREGGNLTLIEKKLIGWEMTDDETKEQVPFTPENLAALLLIPPTPMAIALAFWETVNGARAKN